MNKIFSFFSVKLKIDYYTSWLNSWSEADVLTDLVVEAAHLAFLLHASKRLVPP